MSIKKIYQIALWSLLFIANCVLAHPPQVIWTAVFSDIVPINKSVSQAYCEARTPSVVVTTISQITSQRGIRALNGVRIRYLSYKTIKKNNLYFNLVSAVVSGKDAEGKPWAEPMKLYEQTLSPVAVTYTVWSTKHCKGTFLGTPTKLQS